MKKPNLKNREEIKKPWGKFNRYTLNEKSTVKILTLRPLQEFSLQKHKNRQEFWVFLDNPALVIKGERKIKVKKGDEVMINKGQEHRIKAYSKPVNVLEISFGQFKENDIKRLEDRYGRIN